MFDRHIRRPCLCITSIIEPHLGPCSWCVCTYHHMRPVGTIRMPLSRIKFSSPSRPLNDSITQKLLQIFVKEGCGNDNPFYAIPALLLRGDLITDNQGIIDSDDPRLKELEFDCLDVMTRGMIGVDKKGVAAVEDSKSVGIDLVERVHKSRFWGTAGKDNGVADGQGTRHGTW
ncbi:hypothetical protein DFH27DRAFT_648763 [Peziza echinospora]|nr:hypothetical protein DFH27DRAFT_648763 [Peziza echinospora]